MKKYIQLELRVGQGKIADNEFTYWRKGESSWGYTYVYPGKAITDRLINWIGIARNYSKSFSTDEAELEEIEEDNTNGPKKPSI